MQYECPLPPCKKSYTCNTVAIYWASVLVENPQKFRLHLHILLSTIRNPKKTNEFQSNCVTVWRMNVLLLFFPLIYYLELYHVESRPKECPNERQQTNTILERNGPIFAIFVFFKWWQFQKRYILQIYHFSINQLQPASFGGKQRR